MPMPTPTALAAPVDSLGTSLVWLALGLIVPEGVVRFPLGRGAPDGVMVSMDVTMESMELSVGAADTMLVTVLLLS